MKTITNYVQIDGQRQEIPEGDCLDIAVESDGAVAAAISINDGWWMYEIYGDNGAVFYWDGVGREGIDVYRQFEQTQAGSYVAKAGPNTLTLVFNKAGDIAVLTVEKPGKPVSERVFVKKPSP